MVVAKLVDPASASLSDVVFILEKTAVCGAYLNELRVNYILPTLEFFNGGPLENDCDSFNNRVLYALITYQASDCLPDLSANCCGPISTGHEFLSALDKIEFSGGGSESHAHLAEGLAMSLQCFEDFQNYREPGVTSQKYCILICNAPPYQLPSTESLNYSGLMTDKLAALMNEKNINFSVMSPRKIPALLKLYQEAGGDVKVLQSRNFAKDPRHLVLLKGFSLQERPVSPTTVAVQPAVVSTPNATVLPSSTVVSIHGNVTMAMVTSSTPTTPSSQPVSLNPNMVGMTSFRSGLIMQPGVNPQMQGGPQMGIRVSAPGPQHLNMSVGIMAPTTQAMLNQHSFPLQQQGPPGSVMTMNPGMGMRGGMMVDQARMGQFAQRWPNQGQGINIPGQVQLPNVGQQGQLGPPQFGPTGSVGNIPGQSQANMLKIQANQRPTGMMVMAGPGGVGLPVPVSAAQVQAQHFGQQQPNQQGMIGPSMVGQTMMSQGMGMPNQQQMQPGQMQMSGGPPGQQGQPDTGGMANILVRMSGPPGVAGQNISPGHLQQQQQQAGIGSGGGVQAGVGTGGPMLPNILLQQQQQGKMDQPQGQLLAQQGATDPSGSIQQNPASSMANIPQQAQVCKDYEVIWRGVLEWQDKPKTTATTEQRVIRQVTCHVSASTINGNPEVKADTWAPKLAMQLVQKALITNIGGVYLKNYKSVVFHPQPCPALDLLSKTMSQGVAGCVFTTNPKSPTGDVSVLILLFCQEKATYLGFIPHDQNAFMDCIRKAMQRKTVPAGIRQLGGSPMLNVSTVSTNSISGGPSAAVIGSGPMAPGGPVGAMQITSSSPMGQPSEPGGVVQMPGAGGPPPTIPQQQQTQPQQQQQQQQPGMLPGMAGISPEQQQQQQQQIRGGQVGMSLPLPVGGGGGEAQNQPGIHNASLSAARQQNLMKIQQLQQTLQAAQQQELQFKSQLEVNWIESQSIRGQMQQPTRGPGPGLGIVGPPGMQPRIVRSNMGNNPGLRHLLQQQQQQSQMRGIGMPMQQIRGGRGQPGPGMQPGMQMGAIGAMGGPQQPGTVVPGQQGQQMPGQPPFDEMGLVDLI